MKKYTPVFGPQELFCECGTFSGITAIGRNNVTGLLSYFKECDLSDDNVRKNPIVAMRRVIKEPKCWTVEDQKAGRLPEVGWVVRATGVNEDARIAAINNDAVCVVFEDGGFITLHVSGITPIETPDEKAARLKSEWCAKAAKQLKNLEYTSTLTSIYDAMLSGELQAPKGE